MSRPSAVDIVDCLDSKLSVTDGIRKTAPNGIALGQERGRAAGRYNVICDAFRSLCRYKSNDTNDRARSAERREKEREKGRRREEGNGDFAATRAPS